MRAVGVEEELLLADGETGRPRSVSSQVLRTAWRRGHVSSAAQHGGSVERELQENQLETVTPPLERMSDLETSLREWRGAVIADARESGARVLATGTSPMPADPQLVRSERFDKMFERFGMTATDQLTCGCHVHVSVDSDDEAVGAIDRARVWLPVLLALSGNSPYWQGCDSGYASYRSQVLVRWPTAGPPDVFGSADAYKLRVEAMLATGVPLDEGMLYQDARPSGRYPTVELRVGDVCMDVRDAVLLAALSRGLVETSAAAWASGASAPQMPTAVLRLATWLAARDGVSHDLIDPETGHPSPARKVIAGMLDRIRPALVESGDVELVEAGLQRVLVDGNGATHQRAVLERTGQLLDVTAHLARVTASQE